MIWCWSSTRLPCLPMQTRIMIFCVCVAIMMSRRPIWIELICVRVHMFCVLCNCLIVHISNRLPCFKLFSSSFPCLLIFQVDSNVSDATKTIIVGSFFLEWASFVYQIEIALILYSTLFRTSCVTLWLPVVGDQWSIFFERAVSQRFSNCSIMISYEYLFCWGQTFWIQFHTNNEHAANSRLSGLRHQAT